jgi:MFS family permease
VSGLQWTIDAYTLVLASLLMLAGSTADRVGRRGTFQTGLALFTLGSLLCSVAPSLGWLIAFRMVQAVGGSMLNPVAMSIITNTFTDPASGPGRSASGAAWSAVSMALGPVLGGALVGRSAGGRSSGSTCRSASRRSCWPRRFVPESRAAAPAPDRPGRPGAGARDCSAT